MRGRRWRGARRLGMAATAAAVLGVLGATSAAADCGNTAAAVLSGRWQYRATVSYSGTSSGQHLGSAAGSKPVSVLSFASTCTGPSRCSLTIGSAADPTIELASASDAFYGPGAVATFSQSGSDYSGVSPSVGIGGFNLPPCSPPPNSFAYTIAVHVAAAARDASGTWQPTYASGSEVTGSWWTCSGGVGVLTEQRHVDFVAVPDGRPFPASVAALCAPATPGPVTVAGPVPPPPLAGPPQQSTISSALASPSSAFGSLGHAAGNALITLGIVLLITFPATLFNKTFEENHDDIRDMVTRRFGWAQRLARRATASAGHRRDMAVFGLVVIAGAVLGSLNDPHFGFNRSSLLTFSAVILAVLFGLGVGTLVGYLYRRSRRLAVSARLTALPTGLVIAAACVAVSRLTQFQPGYLYGVICGVAFTASLERDQNGHLVAISSAVTLAVAVAAWLAWVPVHRAADVPGATPVVVIAGNFLAAVFVGGLVGSVIGLVPLRFLPGGELSAWSRAAWGVLFGLAVFGLLQVMLRPESSSVHTGTTAVITAGVLFVVFGGSSVAFRVYFARRRRVGASPAG